MAHLKEGTINQENIGLNIAFLLNMEMFEKGVWEWTLSEMTVQTSGKISAAAA